VRLNSNPTPKKIDPRDGDLMWPVPSYEKLLVLATKTHRYQKEMGAQGAARK